MQRLSHRANFHTYSVDGKPVVLYEDHRSLVFVLWHALHTAKVLTAPPMLVYFDQHDDAKAPSSAAMLAAQTLRKSSTEKDILSFVEWDLGVLDDDWLFGAMELGVVGDAVLVGCEDAGNLGRFDSTYVDHTGISHRIWHLDHLWDALENKGSLTDQCRRSELSPLWDALGWNPQGYFATEAVNLVLDFDLDCFAGRFAGCTLPWPPDIFANSFARRSVELNGRISAQEFLLALRDQSPFVTIARESPFCGGTAHSQQILETLDQILWGGELFARP